MSFMSGKTLHIKLYDNKQYLKNTIVIIMSIIIFIMILIFVSSNLIFTEVTTNYAITFFNNNEDIQIIYVVLKHRKIPSS